MFKIFFLNCFTLLLAPCALAQDADLKTRTENTLALSLSDYKYEESGHMSLAAKKVAFHFSRTDALKSIWFKPDQSWFLQSDFNYAQGKADYQSPKSGILNATPNWYFESRALIGIDFNMGDYLLAPYIGLGFRYLYNDLRTNDYRQGYRRESNYLSLPVGLTHKIKLLNQYQLTSTGEYLYLIKGLQVSNLSDGNPVAKDVSLAQPRGYGFRLAAMMRFDDWSVGPTLNYWRIEQSEIGGQPPVLEPLNTSYEVGFKFMKHF